MNKEKLNILFIVPDLKREGAQTQLIDLMNGMDNLKFSKHLFTLEKSLEQLARIDQEHIIHTNMIRRYRYDLLRIANKIAQLIDKEQIDIVHCTLQFAILFGWFGRRLSNRKPKLVAALHTTQNRSIKEELQDRLVYSPILKRCEKVIFVCEKQREVWEDKFPHLSDGKSVAIHNGIDIEYFSRDKITSNQKKELRNRLCIHKNNKVIVCLAAFRPEKGHKNLIGAMAGLSKNVHLLLAGEGERLKAMKSLAQQMPYANRIHFLGNVKDVRTILAIADVSVLASTAVETFSIAMLESMSMEVPVVATRLGGMEEAVIPGKTGELAIPNDKDSLTLALGKVLGGTKELQSLRRNSKALIHEKFFIQGMIKKTESELSGLIS